jgi:hypothetical protein
MTCVQIIVLCLSLTTLVVSVVSVAICIRISK